MQTPFTDLKANELSLDKINELFVKPQGINRIYTPNTTFIEGQRGTGKTMLMRWIENNPQKDTQGNIEFLGVYLRFDRQVFGIPLLDKKDHLFEHYLTILLLRALIKQLSKWYIEEKLRHFNALSELIYGTFYEDPDCSCISFKTLVDFIDKQRRSTIRYFNNPERVEKPLICDYSECFAQLVEILHSEPDMENLTILFLLDEFENISALQQAAVNGMIKIAEFGYTFKVFHRPCGVANRRVLTGDEYLKERDDYTELDFYNDIIGGDSAFKKFMKEMVSVRLEAYYKKQDDAGQREALNANLDIENYLDTISIDDEFLRYNKPKYINELKEEIKNELGLLPDEEKTFSVFLDALSTDVFRLKLFTVIIKKYRERIARDREYLQVLINEFKNNGKKYMGWVHNYKHAVLYLVCYDNVSQKAIAGFDQIIFISNGIARHVLNILHYTFISHTPDTSYDKFTIEEQTKAVAKVAKIVYSGIKNIPNVGINIQSLVLYLGTVFYLYHRDSEIKKWEVNHFTISSDDVREDSDMDRLNSIIHSAITWGVLTERACTKSKSINHYFMNQSEFLLSPILCVYFKISYRKKQNCTLTSSELNTVIDGNLNNIRNLVNRKYQSIYSSNSIGSIDNISIDEYYEELERSVNES